MPIISQANVNNGLLRALQPDDFEALRPQLKRISLPIRTHLVVPDREIAHVWFIESGVVSVVATSPSGRDAEVAMVGREGIIDTAAIHSATRSSNSSFVQVAGSALRMAMPEFQRARAASPALQALLEAFAQSLLIQISQTALANAAGTTDQRLARWLLMADDRIDGSVVSITHDFLSVMLSVRRASITVAVNALAMRGLISLGRGAITIHDRDGLARCAQDLYGVPEAEYARLMGELPLPPMLTK